MVLGGEFDGETGALVTSLLAADLRMMRHLRIIAVLCLCSSYIAIDDVRILTVGHDDHGRCGKDTVQCLTTVYEHIARRGTHEELDAWDAMGIEQREKIRVIVRGTEEETVVHVALPCGKGEFLFEGLQRRGLRHRIGHIEIGGHSSGSRRTALSVDIRLLRQSWLTEMHVVVDNAWEHKTARGVDDFVIRHLGYLVTF